MESALRDAGNQPGLRLIETVLWTEQAAPRWPLHLERLAEGVRALGWQPLPVPAPQGPANPARLRLTRDALGHFDWQIAALPAPKPLWRVALAPQLYSSVDPWLRIKSTHRPLQDAARAALPDGVDELLFANERGEICEGTITNLFFDRGEGLRSPPLACGVLPGVLRRELSAPEEVLRIEDLPRVRLWLGNALRGLIPAALA